MKAEYYWSVQNGRSEPCCKSDVLSGDGIDLLGCLLTDNGGQRFENTVVWLDEGLYRLGQVRRGEADLCYWSRDSWGVELTCGFAKIYSLYDENCNATIALDDFEKALSAWAKFIQVA